MKPHSLDRELKGLYYGLDSVTWIEEENKKLMEIMGPEYSGLYATGAKAVDDFSSAYPSVQWDSLIRTFLHISRNE